MCTVIQRISEGVEVGKVYTFAVGLSDGTIGVMSFELTTTTSVFAWLKSPLKVTSALLIGVAHSKTTPLFVAFSNRQNSTIRTIWAALYEGEYTAETLPEYQPKGYGAELAECQRYYQIRSANNIAAVDMRPTMRLSSPTITSVSGGYAYSADL